jgi:hypothetical protein
MVSAIVVALLKVAVMMEISILVGGWQLAVGSWRFVI